MDETDSSKLPLFEQSVFLILNRQIIPLEKKVTRLGRNFDNDVVLHEEFVSRLHAEIRFEDGRFVLYDRDSTSGTFVNSQKIERCVLNSGDLISLANLQMMFVNNNPSLAEKAAGTTRNLRRDVDSEGTLEDGQ